MADGSSIQRYLCRNCGYRFSEARKPYNGFVTKSNCDAHQKAAKLLVEAEKAIEEKREAGATALTQSQSDIKGKLVEYMWFMKKQGYSPQTIETRIKKLRRLITLGADLLNPESVKEVLAQQPWKISTKANVSTIYGCFAKLNELNWVPPIYKPNYEMPFIPTEAEIDMLIAASGKKLSALLQLIKETGIRIGEACRIRWIDFDPQQKTIRVQAEKNSKPRIFRISEKLVNMLNKIPKKSDKIFPNNPRSLQTWFREMRLRIAQKLGNPRLKEIHFHTIRHWRATMLYHQTKDILHVKEFLGHRSLDSTLVYINLENAIFGGESNSEFHVKVAEKPEEIKALLEAGFDYVLEKDGLAYFRKRK